MARRLKLMLVAGARPNFMKIAPLVHELKKSCQGVEWRIVHTGQHYDFEMSKVFFEEFELPEPDYFLNAGSGTHAEQTAKVMLEFEKVCHVWAPNIAVVVGDVNSTLACSVTAKKLNIQVAHVEAGLRSGDMTMPEEINRIVTDSISDYLFVSEKSGLENLKREGKNCDHVFFVGNIMIDTLHFGLSRLEASRAQSVDIPGCQIGEKQAYAVVTLHRPSNVDHHDRLKEILEALSEISNDMPVFFPIHPRTQKNIKNFDLEKLIESKNIRLMPPLSYLDFLALWKDASMVLTDSGGIQEETTALGIPCFTIRDNTERPITLEQGTNVLVGTTKKGILKAYDDFKHVGRKNGQKPELWDGKTAQRIVSILLGKDGCFRIS